MSTIQTATQQIAAALRLQMAALGTAQKATKGPSHKSNSKRPRSSGATHEPDIAERIAVRLQAVSSDDPLFKRKILRIFLESVITAEFGASLQNDPRFGALIDGVQAHMESDQELSALIDKTLVPLMRSGHANLNK
jgi:hypothetical protein